MLVKRAPEFAYSQVTPKSVYANRRSFLAGLLATGGISSGLKNFPHSLLRAASGSFSAKLDGIAKWPYSTTEKQTSYEDATSYNVFYEFGTGRKDPSDNTENFQTSPWSISIEGAVKKPRTLTMDEIIKLAPLGRTRLSLSLRRYLECGHPVDRLSLQRTGKVGGTHIRSSLRGLPEFLRPKLMSEGKHAGIEFPYVEGLRIDEAMHPLTLLCTGMYGEVSSQTRRRARAHDRPLEIRFQEHQVSCAYSFRRRATAHHVEQERCARLRLLFQRKSQRRRTACQPGQRTPPRRIPPPPDADVQRLRRPGRQHVRRHGSAVNIFSAHSCDNIFNFIRRYSRQALRFVATQLSSLDFLSLCVSIIAPREQCAGIARFAPLHIPKTHKQRHQKQIRRYVVRPRRFRIHGNKQNRQQRERRDPWHYNVLPHCKFCRLFAAAYNASTPGLPSHKARSPPAWRSFPETQRLCRASAARQPVESRQFP